MRSGSKFNLIGSNCVQAKPSTLHKKVVCILTKRIRSLCYSAMNVEDGYDSNQVKSQEGKIDGKNDGKTDGKVNYLTRWKIQLDSSERKMYMVALLEIVAMINNLNEEQKDRVYSLIIKSDICHFLSEKMSYEDMNAMILTNKIVCHLSEVGKFFKNDFIRILKGYLRVINSLPANTDVKYRRDIFTCVSIFVKR